MTNNKNLLSDFEWALIVPVLAALLGFVLILIWTPEIQTNEITCSTPLVVISDIKRTKAEFHLTCNDSDGKIVLDKLVQDVQVGYLSHPEGTRVMGMKLDD